VHPLSGKEIRALRQLRRENMETRYVFITERGGPATTAGFLKMIARTGEAAMGHKNIMHTVRYTEMAPDSVQGFLEGLDQRRATPTADASSFLGCRPAVAVCQSDWAGQAAGPAMSAMPR
jgi:hypothetical protein